MEVDRRQRIGPFELQDGPADLPRAKRRHRRSLGQSRHERGDESAGNHPCNHGMRFQNCTVARRGSVVTAWMKFIHAVNWRSVPAVVPKDSSTNLLPDGLPPLVVVLNAAMKAAACA